MTNHLKNIALLLTISGEKLLSLFTGQFHHSSNQRRISLTKYNTRASPHTTGLLRVTAIVTKSVGERK